MAFCNKCGAQLGDNERFCGKCGNDVTARAAAPVAPPPMPQPMATPPAPYPGQPPMPIIMGAPPGAQPKGRGSAVMWTLVVVAAVLAGLYYIGKHYQPPASTTPGQPTTTPTNNPTQPTGSTPTQTGQNAALVKQQTFNFGTPYNSNGTLEIPGASWVNNSNVALQSATLECDQEDNSGNPLAEMRSTLTGPNNAPVQPGATVPFNTLQMGSFVSNTSKVDCAIVHVQPAS